MRIIAVHAVINLFCYGEFDTRPPIKWTSLSILGLIISGARKLRQEIDPVIDLHPQV